MFKLVLFICAQALIQSISALCIGANNGLDFAAGYGYGSIAPCDAIAPIGVYGAGFNGYGPIAPCDAIAPIGLYGAEFNGYGPIAPCDAIAPFGVFNGFNAAGFNGLGPAALAASNGGGLIVTSASPVAPTGVSMTSENCYEGPLAVSGAIPFLGAVSLEGALPTVGGGAVAYSCGNGEVAILSEDFAPIDALAGPYGVGPYGFNGLAGPYGIAGLNGYGLDGLGYGLNGLGYGLNGLGFGINGLDYGLNGCNGLGYGLNGFGFAGGLYPNAGCA